MNNKINLKSKFFFATISCILLLSTTKSIFSNGFFENFNTPKDAGHQASYQKLQASSINFSNIGNNQILNPIAALGAGQTGVINGIEKNIKTKNIFSRFFSNSTQFIKKHYLGIGITAGAIAFAATCCALAWIFRDVLFMASEKSLPESVEGMQKTYTLISDFIPEKIKKELDEKFEKAIDAAKRNAAPMFRPEDLVKILKDDNALKNKDRKPIQNINELIKAKNIQCWYSAGYFFYKNENAYNFGSNAKNTDVKLLLPTENKKMSKFFDNLPVENYGLVNSLAEVNRNAFLTFMDFENDFHSGKKEYKEKIESLFNIWTEGTGTTAFGIYSQKNNYNLKDKKRFDNLNYDELKGLCEEAKDGVSMLYKIHLQIKREYYNDFTSDFMEFIKNDEYCKAITTVKHIDNFENCIQSKDNPNPMPVIVVYLPLIPGTKEDRNKIISNIINSIYNRYKNVAKELDLNVTPRFNRKIKDFIYLAQDNGDTKKLLKILTSEKDSRIKNNTYTPDFAFFKEWDFEFIENSLEQKVCQDEIERQKEISKDLFEKIRDGRLQRLEWPKQINNISELNEKAKDIKNFKFTIGGGYSFFVNMSAYDTSPNKERLFTRKEIQKMSKFFENLPIENFGMSTGNGKYSRNPYLTFMNFDQKFYIGQDAYEKHFAGEDINKESSNIFSKNREYHLKDKKMFKNLTEVELKELCQEAQEGSSMLYKIHLQIKEDHLDGFLTDFLEFISKDEYCKVIHTIKTIRDYESACIPNEFYTKDLMPVIVVYLPLIPGTKEDRNKIISNIINSIYNRYKNVAKELDLNVTPRFNRKIKDFIYLAQDNGDTKKLLKTLTSEKDSSIKNNTYTPDFAFFKEWDFEFIENSLNQSPKEKEKEPKNALIGLKL